MRKTMQRWLSECKSDRDTIVEFLNWIEHRYGKLVIHLGTGSVQEIDFAAELDAFHGIDRNRLAEENAKIAAEGEKWRLTNDYCR